MAPDALRLDEPYFAPLLDYTAEDRYLSACRHQERPDRLGRVKATP
jgi:hypothetical protein